MLSPDRTLEHELGDLVESHTIVPVQFFGPVRGWRDLAGEYRLMIAILEDAIDICCRPPWRRCSGRRLLRETEAWLESTDCSWVFSFERICEALNLDPDSVRQRIRTHRQHAVVRALRTLRERQRPLHGAGGLPEEVCRTIPASVSPETAGDSYLPEEVPAA